jgi:hypothetical protein
MPRVNPGGWVTGDPITATQINDLDISQSALDTAVTAGLADITALQGDVTTLQTDVGALQDSRHCAMYSIGGSGLADDAICTLTESIDSNSSYALSSNEVQVPEAGYYLITARSQVAHSSTTNPPVAFGINVLVGGSLGGRASGVRWSATPAENIEPATSFLRQITTPASEKISVTAHRGGTAGTLTLTSSISVSALTITRVA